MAIDAHALDRLMTLAGTSAESLAAATGMSGGYVRQLRGGDRPRASRQFVRDASEYLSRLLGESGRVGMALILGDDRAGSLKR